MISFEDDWIATRGGVDELMKYLPKAKITRQHIDPALDNLPSVGHVNFFRSRFSNTQWKIPLEWLKKSEYNEEWTDFM